MPWCLNVNCAISTAAGNQVPSVALTPCLSAGRGKKAGPAAGLKPEPAAGGKTEERDNKYNDMHNSSPIRNSNHSSPPALNALFQWTKSSEQFADKHN